ncbi:septum formation protein Maf [Anaerotruncus sp. G3(2012)]|uniref:Maf family protein n=1 Tax=Anaerotruncus sp. G3(2012) TaxID=1235835 RepID=UPI00033A3FAE|nr:Maf family protein [Anaerotruncus sp. G3(2012)]EOS55737.1 septum formation protein Maf [Anaerotruncus sp. G3(2012)]
MKTMSNKRIILASKSPRRKELMGLLFPQFEVQASDVDETLPEGVSLGRAVELLALRKGQAVAGAEPDALVIAADTLVTLGSVVLGKPTGREDAARMLRLLSGRVHQVYTGVALLEGERTNRFHCVTDVEFSPLTEEEIRWYLSTGEPFDKAGAYGIQGYGARFIRGVREDFFNVMGLPVNELYRQIMQFTK